MSVSRKVLYGSASNVLRLVLSALVAMVLPPVLVHHLSEGEYSSWVLILQLSTYLSLLDLGLQTVISKLVAEHHARQEHEANRELLSTSFSVLALAAVLGAVLLGVMVWQVPRLFHQMPAPLVPEVRLGLALIGASSLLGLVFSPFLSVFTGLQQYGLPTVLAMSSRVLCTLLLVVLVLRHGGLVSLALTLAAVNTATALAQFLGWRRYARASVGFRFLQLHRATAARLLRSGGVLAVWSLGELLNSGLDLMVVGHFDYANTGFYAIATSLTNFMLLLLSSLFSPLLPAVSAMQAGSTPEAIGRLTLRASRFCCLAICGLSLPLLAGAYPLLSLWVGHAYAVRTVAFLQLLIVSNAIRQLCYPYSLVVIATGRQHLATIAAVSETVVNLGVSLVLASRIGAVGVALGTLAGALVSLGLHLLVSMPKTRPAIDFSVRTFVGQSLLRPLSCLVPLAGLALGWSGTRMLPARPALLAAWAVATAATMYRVGLTAEDRRWLANRIAGLASGKGLAMR